MSSSATACSVCSARCCDEYTVTVTGYDVWLIASGLRLAPEQFLSCLRVAEPGPGTFKLDHSEARYDIALDKVAVDPARTSCVFLIQLPGGSGRCGIHPYRPQVCQTYPAYLDGDVVGVRDDVMCPIGAWKLSQMNLDTWRGKLEDFVVQRDVYEGVVRCWNQRVDAAMAGREFSVEEYLDFLLNVYRRLAEARDELSPPAWQLLRKRWTRDREGRGNPLDRVAEERRSNRSPDVFRQVLGRIAEILEDFRPPQEADAAPPEDAALLEQEAAAAAAPL